MTEGEPGYPYCHRHRQRRGLLRRAGLGRNGVDESDDHAAAEAWIDGFDRVYRAIRDLGSPASIRYRLNDSGVSVAIAERSTKEMFEGYDGTFIDIDSTAIAERPAEFEDVQTLADDPALIFYTSGTAGKAKGIVHAHRTLLGHNEFDYCHQIGADDVFYGAGDWVVHGEADGTAAARRDTTGVPTRWRV